MTESANNKLMVENEALREACESIRIEFEGCDATLFQMLRTGGTTTADDSRSFRMQDLPLTS